MSAGGERSGHALVTGAAGFVGSRLAARLLADGWRVTGLDNMISYYDVAQKRGNLAPLLAAVPFHAVEADLLTADLEHVLADVDVVFHLAGQPGVRASWTEFGGYVEANVLTTQRLLDAACSADLRRFVYASSSSIYGVALSYPTCEDARPQQYSPYGVTKLAAEHLCGVYARNWKLPTVSLRYFTVYGPSQRPDMAMHRLLEAALSGGTFPVFGLGDQVRDFTYVDDVVQANLAAARTDVKPGAVFNVAGGGSHSLAEVITTVERLTGRSIALDHRPWQAGDVHRTGGAITAAGEILGWSPEVPLEEGLARQLHWHRARRTDSHASHHHQRERQPPDHQQAAGGRPAAQQAQPEGTS